MRRSDFCVSNLWYCLLQFRTCECSQGPTKRPLRTHDCSKIYFIHRFSGKNFFQLILSDETCSKEVIVELLDEKNS